MGDEHVDAPEATHRSVGDAQVGTRLSAVVRHVVDSISPASEVYADAARRSVAAAGAPLLEALAARLGAAQHVARPRVERRTIAVLAGDHGAGDPGISLGASHPTVIAASAIASGSAALADVARAGRARIVLVDAGTAEASHVPPSAVSLDRRPSRNLLTEPAMTVVDATLGLEAGIALAMSLAEAGLDVLAVGALGIGSELSAAALLGAAARRRHVANATLPGGSRDPASSVLPDVTGAPRDASSVLPDVTGAPRDASSVSSDATLAGAPRDPDVADAADARDPDVVRAVEVGALEQLVPETADARDPDLVRAFEAGAALAGLGALEQLAALGGPETPVLVGLMLGAASIHIPTILDGHATGAAALAAAAFAPAVTGYLIAAHAGSTIHARILAQLGLSPAFAVGLGHGEGIGAAMLLPLLDQIAALQR